MPNCDFYAAGSDFLKILEFVFVKADVRVFEAYSPYDQDVTEFHSVEEIARRFAFNESEPTGEAFFFQLVPRKGGGQVRTEKINLRPSRCNGATFRYRVVGWGLIQLQLVGVVPHGLGVSHTNHSSEKRAMAWEANSPALGPVCAWDWGEVTRVSNRLNAFIRRKLAVDKIGSRVVLPRAAALMASGVSPI